MSHCFHVAHCLLQNVTYSHFQLLLILTVLEEHNNFLTMKEFPDFFFYPSLYSFRRHPLVHTTRMTTFPFQHTSSLSLSCALSYTHTHVVWFLCYAEGFQGKFLWTWNPVKIWTVSEEKHSTFHKKQHNGKPLRHIGRSDFQLTSCPVRYHVHPLHITWRGAGTQTQSRSCTHTAVFKSICTWTRHLWA